MFQVTRFSAAARLLGAAALSVATLASLSAAHPAAAAGHEVPGFDHLTITVRDAGADADGTYELFCNPHGGSHPDPDGACAVAERDTRWGEDVFAPVPEGSICTMQYGGPATAHITGTWAGRPVDATYDRRDGCGVSRWDRMVPLLPEVR
ncbi:SSI family serine proteinase inhibitor [Streptomyces sp. NPDC017890]|uniref:SSI family serine proteinase inhibitor n=1 Tax=Streptomyces sp. NPDC017890 TaxID=3365015 RepID=UPI00378A3500